MNLKEKTRDIFNPKYKISDQYKFPEKAVYDNSDCGFRKFKTYDEFTKKFDKVPFTSKQTNFLIFKLMTHILII